MGQAIPVYTAREVRRFAKRAKGCRAGAAVVTIAAVLDGAWREETAKIGGMDRQTLRDWVIRFNDQGPSREFFSKLYGETGAVTIGAEPVITAVAVGTPFRRFLSVYTLIALLIGSLRVLLMVLR
jgi:hypothetical protein